MGFELAEAMCNQAAIGHLGNCTARIDGQPIRAVFDAAYGALLDAGGAGMAVTQPQAQVLTADLPCTQLEGLAFQVGEGPAAQLYTVAEHQPDGTGWSVLLLRKA